MNPDGIGTSFITDTPLPFPPKTYRDGSETIGRDTYIGSEVTILNYSAVKGQAQVGGTVSITGASKVIDSARAYDYATITDHAIVFGTAGVYGRAVVDGAEVGGTATVCEGARIRANAVVLAGTYDLTADVAGASHFFSIGPIGSENRTASFYRAYSPTSQTWVGIVAAGCFRGTIAKLANRLDEKEGWSQYHHASHDIERWDEQYRAFMTIARLKESSWAAITGPEATWWAERVNAAGLEQVVRRMAQAEDVS